MEKIVEIWNWIQANKLIIGGGLVGLYTFLEVVVRLTPSKKDDTILERVGQYVGKLMDLAGIPNKKAGGGTHDPINLETGQPDASLK